MSKIGNRQYQIIVWGATGFTGKLVCRHIAQNYQGVISWAIAGRDEKKLEQVREGLVEVNPACEKVPIIIAQLDDPASLDQMVSQTRVLISTAGPFIRLGTPVVEACIRNQCHYCDIAGETPWIRRMIQQHHEQAQKANTKIVNSCAFNSVPFDLGVYFVAQHARNTYNRGLKQVQVLWEKVKGGASGGTVNSILGLFSHLSAEEKRGFMKDGYFLLSPEQKGDRIKKASSLNLKYLPESKAYAAASFMALGNSQTAYRSNALQGFKYGEDFEYVEGLQVSNYFADSMYLLKLGAFLTAIMSPLIGPCVRQKVFPAAGDGPSWETMTNGYYHLRFVGVPEGDQQPKTVEAKVEDNNRDPCYWGTSRLVLENALCLALQEDELKREGFPSGGVLTPAAAMGHLLIQRLQKANVHFTISKP